MIEKKFIKAKKEEFAIKEFVKGELGKGRISNIRIERTPVGERIIVHTSKPGLLIGRKGEKIDMLTDMLKKKFGLENPNIDIQEISNLNLDAQTICDEIALSLERFGPLSFKIIAYKALQRIKDAGALGAEIRLSGKLPSERAKSWRFAFGFLKKTGDTAKIVNRAKASAQTIPGTIGVKVSILPPDVYIHDRITIDKEIIARELKEEIKEVKEEIEAAKTEATTKKGEEAGKGKAEAKKKRKKKIKEEKQEEK